MEMLSKAELQEKWWLVFKRQPPTRASREFMLAHLGWQERTKRDGGLSRRARGQIKQLTQQLRDGVNLTPERVLIIKTGTRLLRNYKGVKHEVVVVEGGFKYQGKTYRSLTGIANHITGSKWNGKLFFGVKQ